MRSDDDARVGTSHNRAICCECGAVRVVACNYAPRLGIPETPAHSEEHFAEIQSRGHYKGSEFGHRLTGMLKCSHCAVSTRHAILRDCSTPEVRNYAEQGMYPPQLDAITEAATAEVLRKEIERLHRFGIQFNWSSFGPSTEPTTLDIDQSKFDGSYTFTLNQDVPAMILFSAIRDAFEWITDPSKEEKFRWRENKSARRVELTYRDCWVERYAEFFASTLDSQQLGLWRAEFGV